MGGERAAAAPVRGHDPHPHLRGGARAVRPHRRPRGRVDGEREGDGPLHELQAVNDLSGDHDCNAGVFYHIHIAPAYIPSPALPSGVRHMKSARIWGDYRTEMKKK